MPAWPRGLSGGVLAVLPALVLGAACATPARVLEDVASVDGTAQLCHVTLASVVGGVGPQLPEIASWTNASTATTWTFAYQDGPCPGSDGNCCQYWLTIEGTERANSFCHVTNGELVLSRVSTLATSFSIQGLCDPGLNALVIPCAGDGGTEAGAPCEGTGTFARVMR